MDNAKTQKIKKAALVCGRIRSIALDFNKANELFDALQPYLAPLNILLGSKLENKDARKFRKATERLRNRNLIFGERRGKQIIFELTDDGRAEADKIKLKLEMAKRKRWDGKWRIIIFDVPEKLRGKRDMLRRELTEFGFMQLQKSVWAYPYPLPKEFIDLWQNAGIWRHCVIIEASQVTNNDSLKEFYFPSQQ